MDDHPVRLVVEDDLHRSRLTVFLRLLLAIPHLFILLLYSVFAFVVAVVGWIAAIFTGRLPNGIHGVLAGYLRYATRVDAYIGLAANPWPPISGDRSQWMTYPIDLELPEATKQRRLTVLFRLFLAIPALILSGFLGSALGGAGGAGQRDSNAAFTGVGLASTATVLGWFASLVRGRMPRGLRDLIVFSIGFGAQTWAYVLLVTGRYPDARPDSHVDPLPLEPHPVRIEPGGELRRSRLTVFFRLLLSLPHLVWLTLWGVLVTLAAIVAWLATLVTGRNPVALQRFIGAYVRYQTHVYAFLFLVGGPFPGFDGRPGAYPVELTIDRSARQHRLVTLFRLLLGIPAILLSLGFFGVLFLVGVYGWIVGLLLGRMPVGLAELGAAALRYLAQTNAYLLLLTDRYPYSSPALATEQPEPEPEPSEPDAPAEPEPSEPVH